MRVLSTPPTTSLPSSTPNVPSGISSLRRLNSDEVPAFTDDGDTDSLRAAALQSLAYYQNQPPDRIYTLGTDTYTAREMAGSVETFVELLDSATTREAWSDAIRQTFWFYASGGSDRRGTVTFSSYYEPTIQARLVRGGVYRYPIYARPPDLVDVDLGSFIPAYAGARIAGRREGEKLVPYYTRGEIDSDRRLAGQGLELAWAKDPADIFFLQIEGSGWLDLGNGVRQRIRYDGNNGRPYRSVGLYLIQSGRAGAKGFDHKAFVRYLRRHPDERQAMFNVDERYIFFQIDTSTAAANAYGNLDVPLTPERSIATDPKIFPQGALAWIDVAHAPAHQSVRRFMLNQDEGSAIQGAGRVDYFAGSGARAEKFATRFWYPGRLYFLVKKRS